ncbi:MAG: hypothetical protein IJ190_05910 [Prevotella sp.]|nr:hypothetical protein [Prevotella sp.]
MLGNASIKDYVRHSNLIDNYDEECLRNSSYRLRVGKLIRPGGNNVLDFDSEEENQGWSGKIWRKIVAAIPQNQGGFKIVNNRYELKPNELIIFQTKEIIKMPLNLSATYAALDSVAKQGILLINASMVEPGYEGYLSGVLLNFSSRSFYFTPNMEIVKISFSEVNGDVEDRLHERIDNYTEQLQEKAQNYTQTFLDIDRIEKDVISKTAHRVRRQFVWGGWILLFFLAFCTLEPVLYKYIWHDSWVPLNSTQIELERSIQKSKEKEMIESLTKKVDSLELKLKKNNARPTNSKP